MIPKNRVGTTRSGRAVFLPIAMSREELDTDFVKALSTHDLIDLLAICEHFMSREIRMDHKLRQFTFAAEITANTVRGALKHRNSLDADLTS